MNNISASRVTLAIAQLGLCAPAFAHPGHNHSHWSSPAAHTLLFVALAGITGAAIWAYRSRKQQSRINQKKDS